METISNFFAEVRADMPRDPIARWASLFFTGFVLSLVVSVAATQIFLALAGVFYFAYLLRAKPQIGFPPVIIPLALFCLFTVISVFFAENPAAGGFEVRKLVLFLILLFTVNLIVSARHLLFLFKAIFVESAAASLVAAYQFIRQYQEVRVEHPRRVYSFMTVTRIHGFMGHWMNFGGQQMLVFLLLGAFLLLAGRKAAEPPDPSATAQDGGPSGRWRTTLWWIVAAIIAASILLNLTRGVWVGCFVGGLYLIARWRARWLLALPVLILITLVAGPRLVRRREESVMHPTRDPSVAIRLEMWRAGLKMVERHPLVGVGPDNIEEVYDLYLPPGKSPIVGYHEHLHNDFVQLAAERGLPCLLAWLWFMIGLAAGALRLARKLKTFPWVAHAALAGWLALLAEGFFEFNFGTSPVLMVFLFLVATPFAAERIERLGRDSTPLPRP
ncbi:MAG TPA: O-antigen ligase family protein [Terriglobia bacterium]|nr:O-antigen ligase family protein [Terriglobia bacterium]